MAEEQKAKSYMVPPGRPPSYFNSSAVVGLVAGMLIPIPFAPLIGAAFGALIGKRKMEEEHPQGKEVTAPTMWNKGTFLGAALTVLLFVGTGGLSFVGMLGAAALTAGGAWVGGRIGFNQQQKEYTRAQEYAYMYGNYTPPQPIHGAAASPTVAHSPQQQPTQAPPSQQQQPRPATTSLSPAEIAQLRALHEQGRSMAAATPATNAPMADRVTAGRTGAGLPRSTQH